MFLFEMNLTRFSPMLPYGNILSIECFFFKQLIFVALKSKNDTMKHFSLTLYRFWCGLLHCFRNFKGEKCR